MRKNWTKDELLAEYECMLRVLISQYRLKMDPGVEISEIEQFLKGRNTLYGVGHYQHTAD